MKRYCHLSIGSRVSALIMLVFCVLPTLRASNPAEAYPPHENLPLPTESINILGPADICINQPTTFSVLPVANALYTWTAVNGTLISGQGTSSVVAQWHDSGPNKMILHVDALGILYDDTLLVQSHRAPQIDLGPSGAYCGQTLAITPGPGFDTYLWSGGGTVDTLWPSAPGTYWVRVTDNFGCTASDTIHLQNGVQQPGIYPPGPIDLCDGQSAMLLGPNGYAAYEWNGMPAGQTVIVNQSMSLTLVVVDSLGCRSTVTTTNVNVNALPIATITQSQDTLWASPGASSYKWYRDGVFTGTTTDYIVPTLSGNYTVTITDGNSCEGESTPFVYSVVATDPGQHSTLKLWPNPVQTTFSLELPSTWSNEAVSLTLIDATGRTILLPYATETSTHFQADITTLSPGIYVLQASTPSQRATTKLIISE